MQSPTRPGTLTRARARTHTDKHVIIIDFPRHRWYVNVPWCYVIRTLPVLLCLELCMFEGYISNFKRRSNSMALKHYSALSVRKFDIVKVLKQNEPKTMVIINKTCGTSIWCQLLAELLTILPISGQLMCNPWWTKWPWKSSSERFAVIPPVLHIYVSYMYCTWF